MIGCQPPVAGTAKLPAGLRFAANASDLFLERARKEFICVRAHNRQYWLVTASWARQCSWRPAVEERALKDASGAARYGQLRAALAVGAYFKGLATSAGRTIAPRIPVGGRATPRSVRARQQRAWYWERPLHWPAPRSDFSDVLNNRAHCKLGSD